MAASYVIDGVYRAGAEKPDLKLFWEDGDGRLIDFSAGYTFALKCGDENLVATSWTKTTGITGAAGSLTATPPTPNVVVSFTASDLGSLAAGRYVLQLRATTASVDRDFPPITVVIGSTLP
jgi:hypothetical protein